MRERRKRDGGRTKEGGPAAAGRRHEHTEGEKERRGRAHGTNKGKRRAANQRDAEREYSGGNDAIGRETKDKYKMSHLCNSKRIYNNNRTCTNSYDMK